MSTINLILASASPRRRAFLQALDLPHRAVSADVDERPLRGEAAPALATRLALSKSRAVARAEEVAPARAGKTLILGADTVVAQGERLLGKPADRFEAEAMLRSLRGKEHQVHSALALVLVQGGQIQRERVRVDTSRVVMRTYSEQEMRDYVASGDPFDKAGAYAIQDRAFGPVQCLDGCAAGVMGLSLVLLRDELAAFGVALPMALGPICRQLTGMACCQSAVGCDLC